MEAENKWLYPDTLKCNFACGVYGIGFFCRFYMALVMSSVMALTTMPDLKPKKLLLKHVTQVELDFELACNLIVVVTFHLN